MTMEGDKTFIIQLVKGIGLKYVSNRNLDYVSSKCIRSLTYRGQFSTHGGFALALHPQFPNVLKESR